MANFDRRGPEGLGPMTGRGMGFCTGAAGGAGRGAYGRGGGFGNGRGGRFGYGAAGRGMGNRYGRGNGWGRGFYPTPVDYYVAERYENLYPRENEVKMLQEEAAFMESRINEINARIAELDAKKETEGEK